MKLILGNSLPLATDQENFSKLPYRFQSNNILKPLQGQGVSNFCVTFELNQITKLIRSLFLQSNLVVKILYFNIGHIKKNRCSHIKQQIYIGFYDMNLFGLRIEQCKKIGEFVFANTCRVSLNSKTHSSFKTLLVARFSRSFYQSCGNQICTISPYFHSNMAFCGQPVTRLRLTDKVAVEPSRIFSLLGVSTHNPPGSPLELLGLNPVF